MPNLSCSVTKCKHNSDHMCVLDSIKISGGDCKEGTRCDSFSEGNSAKNQTGEVAERTHVYCLAKDCNFNNSCDCVADSIDICPCNTGSCCDDTQCRSYTK